MRVYNKMQESCIASTTLMPNAATTAHARRTNLYFNKIFGSVSPSFLHRYLARWHSLASLASLLRALERRCEKRRLTEPLREEKFGSY